MKRKYIKNTALSGLFIAAAIVLPFLTGQIPEIGNMLLPMHLPVMLCGLICGAPWGAAVGFITPLARSLMFGAPVFFPRAIAMAPELALYGFITGLLYSLFKNKSVLSLYVSLVCAMLAGRAAWGIMMACLLGFSEFTLTIFLTEAFINAVPGIVLQLILIPSIMIVLRKARIVRYDEPEVSERAPSIPPDLLAHIYETRKENERFIIAIDGRCGAGKSTLAAALGKKLSAPVFHVDDFFLPENMRTEERLSEPGGNFERERLISEVLKPLSKGLDVRYRRYDCSRNTYTKAKRIPYSKIAIIEGSYALHPELCPYYNLKVFLDIDKEKQTARILEREGEERARVFLERWIPLEEKYFSELGIIESCDKIINKNL